LGRIRFNFPNKFLVYQHDTPDKYLFAKEERAFSHGCMRVQNPDQYASVLVNITYQTAFVDDSGKLQFRRDVYGRDATMLALLRNSHNKDLETVVAHAQPNYSHPVANLPDNVNFASDNSF